MQNSQFTRTLKVVGVGCLLFLTACGGGDAAAEPVEEQVGLSGDAALARQSEAENLIRDCMKAKGFNYVPVDPAAQRAVLTGARDMSDEDFEKQFGYGITTLYEKRLQQAAAGPNEKVRSSLGASDRAAYDSALFGNDPTATFAVAIDTGDFTKLGGCLKQATEQVFGGADLVRDITTKLDELDERIAADPRVTQAVDAWSGCMRAKGFDLATPDAVDSTLQERLEAIVGTADRRVANYEKDALSELQRHEVALVTADIACEKQHLTSVEDEVRAEYEREFRGQNADLLSKAPTAAK